MQRQAFYETYIYEWLIRILIQSTRFYEELILLDTQPILILVFLIQKILWLIQ